MSDIDKTIAKLEDETTEITVADIKNEKVKALFDNLPTCMTEGRTFTIAEVNMVATQLKSLKHGIMVRTPMICRGPECSVKDWCSLYELGVHPLLKPCPLEIAHVEHLMTTMISNLGIDTDNAIEMSLLGDLVQAEIMDMRATGEIAKNGC